MQADLSFPPTPMDPAEAQRWDHSRLRRRLLYGLWRPDALHWLIRALGDVRADQVGEPDLGANTFRTFAGGVAALYDRPYVVRHQDEAAASAMTGIVERSGLQAQMIRIQRDTIGIREMLVAVDARLGLEGDPSSLEVCYRPVFPDLVLADPDPVDPERPIRIREARRWTDPRAPGRSAWVWDTWDVADPAMPVHRIVSAQADGLSGAATGADVSHMCGLPEGGESGEAYPVRGADGRPRLPYVVFHAARTGSLWDPYEVRELVDITLNVSVKWTLFGHFLRNASWPQRYVIGAEPAGMVQPAQGGQVPSQAQIPADPTFVLQLQAQEGAQGQPTASSWTVSSDPKAMAEAIYLYEERGLLGAGLAPSEIQRGDPRSGIAIAINREGRRESQRRYEPIFAAADQELLGLTALLVNRALGSRMLPETGWEVQYQALPPSAEERAAEREHALALLAAGLVDKPAAYQMVHPASTREEAEEATGANAPTPDATAASPFASVGLPALVQAGIIGASAARRLLGVGEDSAPTSEELAALRGPTKNDSPNREDT